MSSHCSNPASWSVWASGAGAAGAALAEV